MKDNTINEYRHVTRNGKGAVIYRKYSKLPDGTLAYDQYYTRRIVRNKKQYYFKLATTVRDAEKRSNEIDTFLKDPMNSIHDAIEKFNPDKAERLSACNIMVSDLVKSHEDAEPALEIKEDTALHYRTSMMRIVRVVEAYRTKQERPGAVSYKDAMLEVSKFPVSQLNARFISDLKMAEMKSTGGSLIEQTKVKRRLNSVLADARSLLSDAAMEEYRAAGLELPDMDPFMKTAIYKRVSKKRYRLPDIEVIETIQSDMHELREDMNAYRMYLLAMGAGLRKAEILNCRKDWIAGGDQPTVRLNVTDDWEQKGHGESVVELCEWAYKELSNCMTDDERVIVGTVTDREDTARYLCKWLRSKGLDRHKPVHELRMLYGSWVANRFGLFVAQKRLRHKDAQVTSDSYTDLITDENILKFWDKEKPKKSKKKSKKKVAQ